MIKKAGLGMMRSSMGLGKGRPPLNGGSAARPRLPKPPDRRQRFPPDQQHFLKTWGAQRQKQSIHPQAVSSRYPEPPGKTEATWFNVAFHRRGNRATERKAWSIFLLLHLTEVLQVKDGVALRPTSPRDIEEALR
nr:uncharacterized protein LOC105718136 [Aotus nancymaae]